MDVFSTGHRVTFICTDQRWKSRASPSKLLRIRLNYAFEHSNDVGRILEHQVSRKIDNRFFFFTELDGDQLTLIG